VSVSIGQGQNLWTPLQLATAYAVIANGGTRYKPHILKRVMDPDGTHVRESEPEIQGEAAVSRETLEIVKSGLYGVVNEPHGTGYVMLNLPGGVKAAGKTGTAQVVNMPSHERWDSEDLERQHRDHAWFVTYAPAEAPRIVVAVLVEHGGHGGSAAAPVARDVVMRFLENEMQLHAGHRP
jgi:penicillin-binding protein 2